MSTITRMETAERMNKIVIHNDTILIPLRPGGRQW